MADVMPLRRARVWWRRRPDGHQTARRCLLGLIASAGAVTVVGGAGPAGASDKEVALVITWHNVPDGTRVPFSDVGGNCDADKRFPSYDLGGTAPVFLRLFVAKSSGSCAFDATNARFRIHLRTPNTAQASLVILIAQGRAGGSYGAYCDKTEGVGCASGGEKYNAGSSVIVEMTIGPVTATAGPTDSAYHFCAAESHLCGTGTGSTVADRAGAGAHGRYVCKRVTQPGAYYAHCNAAWFDGQDPVPGVRKACFAKSPRG